MKKVSRILILCLSALPFAGLDVRAEDVSPCAGDMAKFCKGVLYGEGRVMDCLKGHEEELSPACKDHQLAMIKRLKEAPQVCQDDVERFCRNVRPENRRILRCLKQNEAKLSRECGNVMKDVN